MFILRAALWTRILTRKRAVNEQLRDDQLNCISPMHLCHIKAQSYFKGLPLPIVFKWIPYVVVEIPPLPISNWSTMSSVDMDGIYATTGRFQHIFRWGHFPCVGVVIKQHGIFTLSLAIYLMETEKAWMLTISSQLHAIYQSSHQRCTASFLAAKLRIAVLLPCQLSALGLCPWGQTKVCGSPYTICWLILSPLIPKMRRRLPFWRRWTSIQTFVATEKKVFCNQMIKCSFPTQKKVWLVCKSILDRPFSRRLSVC